ncbi:hypothetical protein NE237_003749 [Protea cynaroides]|uniref:Uncharacterized protein n=1 Tax=Protea cynaroides TaxID=273540 RepID=A0A9Q0QSW3_9MAGN|nr:hypothetical protein NE237_003749 [Protea cynaroides]
MSVTTKTSTIHLSSPLQSPTMAFQSGKPVMIQALSTQTCPSSSSKTAISISSPATAAPSRNPTPPITALQLQHSMSQVISLLPPSALSHKLYGDESSFHRLWLLAIISSQFNNSLTKKRVFSFKL